MFYPIQSYYTHCIGRESTLPQLTSMEKAVVVFSSIAAVGGFLTTTALVVTFNTNWAIFSLGIFAFSLGVFVLNADGYRYRVIQAKESTPILIIPRKNLEEPFLHEAKVPLSLEIEGEKEEAEVIEESNSHSLLYFESVEKIKPYEANKSKFTGNDLNVLSKFHSFIFSHPEFTQFSSNKRKESDLSSLYDYLIHLNDGVFQAVFESSLKTLSCDADLEKKRLALLQILPFLFKFFNEQKLNIDRETFKKIILENLNLEELYKEASSFQQHLPYLLDKGFFLIEPFIQFLTEKTSEKKFLFEFIYQLVFALVPYFLKDEVRQLKKPKKTSLEYSIERVRNNEKQFSQEAQTEIERTLQSIENRLKQERLSIRFFVYTLNGVAIPHCSKMCATQDFSNEAFEKYYREIAQLFSQCKNLNEANMESLFAEVKNPQSPIIAQTEDLPSFTPIISSFFNEAGYRLDLILNELKGTKPNSSYDHFLKELKQILSTTSSEIATYFPQNDDPGTIFGKSYLLSRVIWNSLRHGDLKKSITLCIEYLALSIEEAGLDASKLREHAQILATKGIEEFEKFEKEGVDLVNVVPIQDILSLLFLGFFAIRNLSKMRPFIARHLPAMYQLLEDWDVKSYKENKTQIRAGTNTFLALLKPVNGAITGAWPGKSFVIKKSINVLISSVMGESKTEKETFEGLQPLLLFAILGTFGSKDKEKRAFAKLEGNLKTFYRELYNFDLSVALQNSHFLNEHVEKCVKILVSSGQNLS